MKSKYLKSPLNYTGGKYHLLKQIVPLFPKKIDTFVDLFTGGCNLSINVDAKKILANDANEKIIELHQFFKDNSSDYIIKSIEKVVDTYELSNTRKYGFEFYNTTSMLGVAKHNKLTYEKLRQDYNQNKTPLMLYVLIIFAFNNQIRFNPNGDFNSSVNKRDFNKQLKNNLEIYIDRLKKIDITFSAKDYKNIIIPENSFVYIDPPYLVTQATYNEKNAWSEKDELNLLEYLDELDTKKIKFALSNVFHNKDKQNHLLMQWSKTYNVHKLKFTYQNASYHSKNKEIHTTQEVLVTNY